MPATAHAKDGAASANAASTRVVVAQAELTARHKRVRKPSAQPARRVASVATPEPYHSRCFLFWCSAGGRTFNALMLGVAY